MVTFGEITTVADNHLADALALLQRPGGTVGQPEPGTGAALDRLIGVLTRYTDEIATGFGAPDNPGARWAPTASRIGDQLRQARHAAKAATETDPALPPPTPPSSQLGDGPLTLRLRAAADALGCALDVLASHFTGEPRRPAGLTATIVADNATARHLLAIVGQHSTTLARITALAAPTGSPLRRAGAVLAEAAARIPAAVPTSGTAVTAVPLRGQPQRLPPAPGEHRDRTIQGIAASAGRLTESDAHESIATWRYVATAAGITHHLGEITLRRLATRLHQLGRTSDATLLSGAAHHVTNTGKRWRLIARRLRNLTTEDRPPDNPVATDAGDLVLRLGRQIHTDAAWAPNRSGQQQLRPPTDLAPDHKTATTLALTVLRAVDAFHLVAQRHHTAVTHTARAGGLWKPLPSTLDNRTVYSPAGNWEVRTLLGHYSHAHDLGRKATTELAHAVLDIAATRPYPGIASHAALLLRRAEVHTATGPRHPAPADIADDDFPIPITDAITRPPATPTQPARRPSPAAHTATTRKA